MDGTYAHGMSEEMTYAHIGRSGLLESRIGRGTLNFGFTVDEPSTIWGGTVAAPAFADIARFALQYLEIPPDAPETLPARE